MCLKLCFCVIFYYFRLLIEMIQKSVQKVNFYVCEPSKDGFTRVNDGSFDKDKSKQLE